ncbi:hypothetical protein D3C79_802960 [compost metagenome]
MQGQVAEGQGEQAQQQREQQRQQQTLHQHLAQGCAVGTPGRLGGKPGGAHAQKTHDPGQEGVQAGTHGDRTQLVGMRQVTDHRTIDQRHQGYGNIRENHRRGQCPDLAVGRAVAPVGQQSGHVGSRQAGHCSRSARRRPG